MPLQKDVKSVKTVTVADFLAAEESPSQYYQLTGTVSNIASTLYGNFDITDESGKVYVYGLLQAGKAQANSSNHWVLLKVIRLLYAVFVPATKIPIKWEAHSSFLK